VVCDELAFYLTLPDKRLRQEFAARAAPRPSVAPAFAWSCRTNRWRPGEARFPATDLLRSPSRSP
jgi:hypothetical protein